MNKLPELQNRDLKKLEQRFDISNAKVLGQRVSHLRHMKVLRKTDRWSDWMDAWIWWEAGQYYGSCPDNSILAIDADPEIFLTKYKEASIEWDKQEKEWQRSKGLK